MAISETTTQTVELPRDITFTDSTGDSVRVELDTGRNGFTVWAQRPGKNDTEGATILVLLDVVNAAELAEWIQAAVATVQS